MTILVRTADPKPTAGHTHRIVHFCNPETPGVQGGVCADPDCPLDKLRAEAERAWASFHRTRGEWREGAEKLQADLIALLELARAMDAEIAAHGSTPYGDVLSTPRSWRAHREQLEAVRFRKEKP